jgi:hypothetical protein
MAPPVTNASNGRPTPAALHPMIGAVIAFGVRIMQKAQIDPFLPFGRCRRMSLLCSRAAVAGLRVRAQALCTRPAGGRGERLWHAACDLEETTR